MPAEIKEIALVQDIGILKKYKKFITLLVLPRLSLGLSSAGPH